MQDIRASVWMMSHQHDGGKLCVYPCKRQCGCGSASRFLSGTYTRETHPQDREDAGLARGAVNEGQQLLPCDGTNSWWHLHLCFNGPNQVVVGYDDEYARPHCKGRIDNKARPLSSQNMVIVGGAVLSLRRLLFLAGSFRYFLSLSAPL